MVSLILSAGARVQISSVCGICEFDMLNMDLHVLFQ